MNVHPPPSPTGNALSGVVVGLLTFTGLFAALCLWTFVSGQAGLGLVGERSATTPVEMARDLVSMGLLSAVLAVVFGRLVVVERRARALAREAARHEAEQRSTLLRLQTELMEAQRRETVGRLATTVAHDFNNLLTPILGFTRLVYEDTDPDDPFRQDLAQVLQATRQATALTEQILSYSRRLPAHPQAVDIGALLSRVRRLLHRIVDESGRLEIVVEDDVPSVFIDEAQLQQVLVNLVVNARDAVGPGGVVRIVLSMDVQGRVCLVVEDDGEGMSEEVLQQAFEPFFSTKGERGTGLGLSTCQTIVQEAGGELHLQSWLGKGTRVEVRLPPSEVDAHADEDTDPRLRRLDGARVLIVEDDDAARGLLMRVLRRAGCHTDAVFQAEDALGRLREGATFDLLVTDLVLTGISGKELLRQLQAESLSLPTVVVSAYVDDPALAFHDLHDDDGVLVLTKPFRPAALVDAARTALGA